MESLIKWQTGYPNETNSYIVTLKDGAIEVDMWLNIDKRWLEFNDLVIAWCKLSEIKPYREEQK